MNTPLASLLLLVASVWSVPLASAQEDAHVERIGAAFVLDLGRAPVSGEVESWRKSGQLSVAELIPQLWLSVDAAERRAVVVRAGVDAFGCEPTGSEITAGAAGTANYATLMQQHIEWLGRHPADYEKVIQRAYQLVLQRAAYAGELKYWQDRAPLSHALLAGCLDNWARRNAPGLMATSGTPTVSVNCPWLRTVRLSPTVAAEVRAASGFLPAGDANLAAATGRNVIAAGGSDVVSNGGIHFLAVGGRWK